MGGEEVACKTKPKASTRRGTKNSRMMTREDACSMVSLLLVEYEQMEVTDEGSESWTTLAVEVSRLSQLLRT